MTLKSWHFLQLEQSSQGSELSLTGLFLLLTLDLCESKNFVLFFMIVVEQNMSLVTVPQLSKFLFCHI